MQAQNVHGDVHVHGSPGSRVPPHQLPATVRHFINRTVEQDALTTLLRGAGDENTVLVSTIDGLAGVGKSTLVVQWAHRVREQFADGELYVNLRGFDPAAEPMSPAEALAAFLSALGVAPEAMPVGEDERAAQFRTLLHGRRMLIVLDNARDTEQIRPLLPGSAGCLVVATSRQRLDGLVAHHGAHRLTLATLTRDEGRKLLERYTGAARLEEEPQATADLLEHCAGLPLALTLVGVQAAAEPDVPLEDLAADLRDERERLDALDAAGTTGVRAVFSWSYRTLSPEAARLFRLLGLAQSPDVSVWAAAALAGVEQRRARRVLAELCRAHLLNRRSGDRYVFHDLTRAYARERAYSDDTEEERTGALQRLLDHYLYAANAALQRLLGSEGYASYSAIYNQLRVERRIPTADDSPGLLRREFATYDEALEWWDAEHFSVHATIRQAVAVGLPRGPVLAHAVVYPLKLTGMTDEWKANLSEGLKDSHDPGDRRLRAGLLGSLGAAHFYCGDYEDAIRHFQESYDICIQICDTRSAVGAQVGLGVSFLELSRYEEAVSSARQALHLEHDSEGAPADEGGADAVIGLALAHLGDYEAAFAHLHRAVEISSETLGHARALDNLGSAYLLIGDVDNAERTFRQVVEYNRVGGNRLGEGQSLDKLAASLRSNGDLKGARAAWDAALAIFEQLGHSWADDVRARLNELDTDYR